MKTYRVGGRNTTSGGIASAVLWNPSSTVTLWVIEITVLHTLTTSNAHAIQRTTTRGTTPASTVTPDIDNDLEKALAPASGALLDLGDFSVTPAIDASVLGRGMLDNAIGAGHIMRFGVTRDRPIRVPPGTGLAVVAVLSSRVKDHVFAWRE